MKASITKGFLEKSNLPLDQVKFAFTLKHIDRYKHYYSVSDMTKSMNESNPSLWLIE